MGRWSREELEEAFDRYQEMANKGGTSGDWRDFADLFTEQATYVEPTGGTVGGREAIYKLVSQLMLPPFDQMIHFAVEWYIIDEDRGWIVYQVWNRMKDPGDGSVHQAYCFTLLKYAGKGLFSYEEGMYNPSTMTEMAERYAKHRDKLAAENG